MEDHVYCTRVMFPTLIVVKEEPIWKLAKKEESVNRVTFASDEEPELELAVSNDVDLGEDPLLISDTEESSLSTESSTSSGSNDGHSIIGLSQVKEEERYFAGISHLNDDNSDEDKDSLADYEVAELLKQNNKLFNALNKDEMKLKEEQVVKEEIQYMDLNDEDFDESDEEIIDIESFDNGECNESDDMKFKSIFQSFLDKEERFSSTNELVKINKSKNRKVEKKKFANNSRKISKNCSEKYSLRKSRPALTRYSPVDFTETIDRTYKKQKFNNKNTTNIQTNRNCTSNSNESSREDFIQFSKRMKSENPNSNIHDIEFKYYENKRHWHNILEKHRRTLLAELFKNLLNQFPSRMRESAKMAKVQILNKAVDYITELIHRDEYLEKVVQALKERQISFTNKLREMKESDKNIYKSLPLKIERNGKEWKIKSSVLT